MALSSAFASAGNSVIGVDKTHDKPPVSGCHGANRRGIHGRGPEPSSNIQRLIVAVVAACESGSVGS